MNVGSIRTFDSFGMNSTNLVYDYYRQGSSLTAQVETKPAGESYMVSVLRRMQNSHYFFSPNKREIKTSSKQCYIFWQMTVMFLAFNKELKNIALLVSTLRHILQTFSILGSSRTPQRWRISEECFFFPGGVEVALSLRDTLLGPWSLWGNCGLRSHLSSSSTQLYLVTELMFPQTALDRDYSSPSPRAGFLEIKGSRCRGNYIYGSNKHGIYVCFSTLWPCDWKSPPVF